MSQAIATSVSMEIAISNRPLSVCSHVKLSGMAGGVALGSVRYSFKVLLFWFIVAALLGFAFLCVF